MVVNSHRVGKYPNDLHRGDQLTLVLAKSRTAKPASELAHGDAAVDVDCLAGDVARLFRGQEGDQVAHVFGGLRASEYGAAGDLVEHGARLTRVVWILRREHRRQPLPERSPHQPRQHGIDVDVVGAEIFGHHAGKVEQRVLGRGVGGQEHRVALGGDRGDIDDLAGAALHHVRRHRLAHEERALDVDGEVLVPVLAGERRERGRQFAAEMAGVVDQDVHLPEGIQSLPHHLRAVLLAGHIAFDRQAAPARLPGSGGRFLRACHVEVGHHHIGSLAGQAGADAAPHAAATAGNDGHFVVQTHASLCYAKPGVVQGRGGSSVVAGTA